MDNTSIQAMPASVERVLQRFERLSREEKMQALVHQAGKLEPLPERFRTVERAEFGVPECQTPLAILPEYRAGTIHFYAAIDARQSPTVASFLAILFSAVNDQPPAVALAIPEDFVRRLMHGMGLASREFGLEAILARVKRYARHAPASP